MYHGEHTIVGIKKILPETWALTGGTVGSSSITGITATKTADEFNGGFMCVLNGSQKGGVYRVIDNGTNFITVDRPTLDDATLGPINSGNSVAMFPMRRRAEETVHWILCDEVSGFTPKKEYDEYFAQTRSGEPYRTGAVEMRTRIEGTLEFTLQDAYMLPLIFGKEVDTGTNGTGLSTALNGTVYPGATSITVDATTSGAVNDYIRVGGSADGEIRKISAVNGTTKVITLDKPLKRKHADNGSVTEMVDDTGSVFTHTFTQYYDNIYRMWPFELILEHTNDTDEGTLTQYIKCVCTGYTFKNDNNRLVVSMDVIGYYFDYDEGTPASAPTEISGDILTYYYSSISINNTVDGKIRSMQVTGNYNGEARYYHTSNNDTYPYEVVFGRMEGQEVSLGVRIEDTKFLKLLDNGTSFDAYAQYNWNGTEYLKLEFKTCYATGADHPIPPGGPVESDFVVTPEYVTVTVIDQQPYW